MADSKAEANNTEECKPPSPENCALPKQEQLKPCEDTKSLKNEINSHPEPLKASTMKVEYRHPKSHGELKDIAKRRALYRKKVIEEMMAEIEKEKLIKDPVEDYCSTYDDMFQIPGFKLPENPVMHEELHLKYPLYSCQPITYWTDKIDKHLKDSARIGGMTKIRDLKSPFRKNGEFTTPVQLRMDSSEC